MKGKVFPGFGDVKIPPINLYNADMISYLLLYYASCIEC